MPTYRTVNLKDQSILYVKAANKAQARSHVARKLFRVETASVDLITEDLRAKVDVNPEIAGDE